MLFLGIKKWKENAVLSAVAFREHWTPLLLIRSFLSLHSGKLILCPWSLLGYIFAGVAGYGQ